MVQDLAKPIFDIDKEFYKYDQVGNHADNYLLMDSYIIVAEKGENELLIKESSKGEKILLTVSFVDNVAKVGNKDLTKEDLKEALTKAI
ncbi:hypothetical protein [Lysinibacillus xylanilyticus]|uniref:hypothetical protein n=1 Tax=Lysinibacillus xylanilyticus TaxID=582475 RepID=UPI003CFC2624